MRQIWTFLALWIFTGCIKPEPSYLPEALSPWTETSMTALPHLQEEQRDATVRVFDATMTSMGTGTYLKYHGHYLVLTASHVIDSEPFAIVAEQDGTPVRAPVIYDSPENDFAFLLLEEALLSKEPVKYRPQKKFPSALVGTHLNYTGYPNGHDLLSLEGRVAGAELNPYGKPSLLMQSLTWFGASGAGVFDEDGRIVGVVVAFDVGLPFGTPLPNIVWVTPISAVDETYLKNQIKRELRASTEDCTLCLIP